jgi:hypothetical protein
MAGTASSGNTGEDPREFASGKVLAVLGVPAEGGETLGFWIEAYLSSTPGHRSVRIRGPHRKWLRTGHLQQPCSETCG